VLAVLVILACIAFLLALFWLSENDAGTTGLVAYVLLQLVKWLFIGAAVVILILIGVYAISIH
jgi:hypothetical protein